MLLRHKFYLIILAALWLSPASAQNTFPTPNGSNYPVNGVAGMCNNTSGKMVPMFSAAGTWQCAGAGLPVVGTFTATASLSGFQPTPLYTTGTATTTSSRIALPAGAQDIYVYNNGTADAFVKLGDSTVVALDGAADIVKAGSSQYFHTGSFTNLAVITHSGSSAIIISGGVGLGVGGGGGGGGGGSVPTGPAGTPNTNVVTVQGIAGATAQPVTGTFWQTTQPVSIATMPTTPVTGTFWQSTQPVSIASMPTTPVTGTFWQTTQPVSLAALPALPTGGNTIGKVNILGNAGGIVDSAAGTPATQAVAIQGVTGGVAVPVTGTLSASIGSFTPTPAYASLSVGASSTRTVLPTGTNILVYNTGPNPAYVLLGNSSVVATTSNDVIPSNSWMEFAVGSATNIAAIETAGATTLTISGGAGIAAGSVGPATTQPVSIATMPTTPVTGTFWQATQPVSIASMPTTPVTGTFWQATQPVSMTTLPSLATGSNNIGSVNQGTPPWSFNQTQVNGVAMVTAASGVQEVGIVGTTGVGLDSAAGTTNARAVTIQGNASGIAVPVSIASMPTTPVTGTFWQSTQPVSLAALPPLATGSNTIGAISNSSFGISGSLPGFASTPTVNLGTIGAAATAANQTNVQSAAGTSATTLVTIQGSASGVAVPVSVSSTSLPTGASTAANQTNVQSAVGSSATTALTVQGASSGVALPVNCTSGCTATSVSDGATFTAGSSAFGPSGGIYQTTVTSNPLVAGKEGTMQLTQYRALMTNPRDSSGVEIIPATHADMAQLHTDMTSAIPTGPNTIGYVGGDGTAGTASTHVLSVQGIASGTNLNTAVTSCTVCAVLGSNNADGVATTTSANVPVIAYNYVWNGSGWDRLKPAAPTITPFIKAGLTNTAISVKASAGTLNAVNCDNGNAATVIVEFFNTSSVTLGTTAPTWFTAIPAGGGGSNLPLGGVALGGSAIYAAAVTAYNGSTAPSTTLNCSIGTI